MVHDLCTINLEYRFHVYTTFVPSFNGEWAFILVYPKSQPVVNPENVSVIPAWIRRSIHTLDTDLLDHPINTVPSISKINRV